MFCLLAFASCAAGLSLNADSTALHTDNVVVIFDGSGSMEGKIGSKTKMLAAKMALLGALKQMPADTQFGMIAFSKNANGWTYELQAFDEKRVWEQVKKIQSGGKTPLGRYIKVAADRLLEERQKQFNYGNYRLIVITDGEASDTSLMSAYAKELVTRGITLNVIGVGMKKEHSLKTTAHLYVAANNVKALNHAVSNLLAEVPNIDPDDVGAEDPYEYLNAFVNGETALAAIDALSSSGNQPLGQKK